MSRYDDKHVITCDGIILWDGITTPDQNDDGSQAHSLKIAIPAQSAERQELEQLAQETLQASDFKGVLPPGGNWPIQDVNLANFAAEHQPLLQGRVAINAKTRLGVPPIYDANGQELAAMQYGRMIYSGAVVRLMVHCYSFNNKSKGVAFGLDGIQIIDGTNAPRIGGTGGVSSAQVGAAFGAAPAAGAPAAGAPAPAPVQPHEQFVSGAAGAAPAPAAPAPQPAAKVMTAKANGTSYEAFIQAGWTDAQLIAEGYLAQ